MRSSVSYSGRVAHIEKQMIALQAVLRDFLQRLESIEEDLDELFDSPSDDGDDSIII